MFTIKFIHFFIFDFYDSFLMKLNNLIISFFLIIFIASNSYSFGLFDLNNNYVFYNSNPNPIINISISSPLEPVTVEKAQITINGILGIYNISNDEKLITPQNKSKDYLFHIEDFSFSDGNNRNSMNSSDIVNFELFAYGVDGEKIYPKGSPTNFKIKLDDTLPTLISYTQRSFDEDNLDLDLQFSEKIYGYILKINGVKVSDKLGYGIFESGYSNFLALKLSSTDFIEGVNLAEVEFYDLANNRNVATFNLTYIANALTIKLITTQGGDYYYNKDYADFFDKTIYSNKDSFNLIIETNKKAICYFSSSQIQFNPNFQQVTESLTQIFSTTDNKRHTIRVNVDGNPIWVACQNKIIPKEIVFLNRELLMNDSLINIVKYTNPELQITNINPLEGIVTNSKIRLELSTNYRSFCKYRQNSGPFENLEFETNYINHFKNLTLQNGPNNIFDFECFDLLNRTISKRVNYELDPSKAVIVVNYEPKYTMSPNLDLTLTLSEDASCRYSRTAKTNAQFLTLEEAKGTGFIRKISLSSLLHGSNNTVYVYCNKYTTISSSILNITYDSLGPRVFNLNFLNSGKLTDYLNSKNNIKFIFNSSSLLPISKYFVEIVKDNNNSFFKVINLSQTQGLDNFYSASISTDISNASKIKIFTQNILGYNSSVIEKNIIIDMTKPEVDISFDNNFLKIVCFDGSLGSGCLDIFYGFSMTSSCKPTILYNSSSSVNIGDNRFVCVKVEDKAGNVNSKITPIILVDNLIENDLEDDNFSTNDTENNSSNNDLEYLDEEETTFPMDDNFPLNPPASGNSQGSNYAIIIAIFLVFLSVGGGGYYAYKKGYLNKELEKLGLSKYIKSNNLSKNTKIESGQNNFFNNPINNLRSNKILKNETKSKYENHLEKLNNFIDNQIKKGEKIFGNFNSSKDDISEKQNLNKDKDKNKFFKSERKSNIDVENFDEIYSISKDINRDLAFDTLEKEAENFEQYYKSKKKDKDLEKDKD